MPSITTDDGIRLDYLESGDPKGAPVVLIAGFKAAATSWRYQVPPLEKAGHRVLAFDRRGHGTSEAPAFGNTMQRHGEDLHEFIAQLDLWNAVLVGGSMGGNTIWSMIDQFGSDRLGGVVIVDQTPKMLNSDGWTFGFYGYDDDTIDSKFAEGIPDPGRHSLAAKGPVRIGRILKAMAGGKLGKPSFTPGELALLNDHAKADWRGVIGDAEVRSLFVAGRESEFWPCEHAAASAALNPRASSTVIDKDGHAANIEQYNAFNEILLGFLAG